MRNTRSSKKSRYPRLKRYRIAKIFLHGFHLFLILFAQTSVIAGPVNANPGTDCTIGRKVEQSTPTLPSGAVDGPAWMRQVRAGSTALDPSKISVLSWNIKKGSEGGWDSDLHRLAAGKDLVLLQEARLTPGFYSVLDGSMHHNGARGWKNSGVLTAARAKHLNRCSYQHDEPILGTPKASLLTEYRLTGVDRHVAGGQRSRRQFRHRTIRVPRADWRPSRRHGTTRRSHHFFRRFQYVALAQAGRAEEIHYRYQTASDPVCGRQPNPEIWSCTGPHFRQGTPFRVIACRECRLFRSQPADNSFWCSRPHQRRKSERDRGRAENLINPFVFQTGDILCCTF